MHNTFPTMIIDWLPKKSKSEAIGTFNLNLHVPYAKSVWVIFSFQLIVLKLFHDSLFFLFNALLHHSASKYS